MTRFALILFLGISLSTAFIEIESSTIEDSDSPRYGKQPNPQRQQAANPARRKQAANPARRKQAANPAQRKQAANPAQKKQAANPAQKKQAANPAQKKQAANPGTPVPEGASKQGQPPRQPSAEGASAKKSAGPGWRPSPEELKQQRFENRAVGELRRNAYTKKLAAGDNVPHNVKLNKQQPILDEKKEMIGAVTEETGRPAQMAAGDKNAPKRLYRMTAVDSKLNSQIGDTHVSGQKLVKEGIVQLQPTDNRYNPSATQAEKVAAYAGAMGDTKGYTRDSPFIGTSANPTLHAGVAKACARGICPVGAQLRFDQIKVEPGTQIHNVEQTFKNNGQNSRYDVRGEYLLEAQTAKVKRTVNVDPTTYRRVDPAKMPAVQQDPANERGPRILADSDLDSDVDSDSSSL